MSDLILLKKNNFLCFAVFGHSTEECDDTETF